ncbi:hypothetical protein BH20ACI2_BH20ACI2_09780 [soil metagenome]
MTKINSAQAARTELATIDNKILELTEQKNAAVQEQVEARGRYARGSMAQDAFDAIQDRINKITASIRALRDWRPDLEGQAAAADKAASIASLIEGMVKSVKGAARSEEAYKTTFIETDIVIATAAAKLAETRAEAETAKRDYAKARESFFTLSGERPDQADSILRSHGVTDDEMQNMAHFLKAPTTDFEQIVGMAEGFFCNLAEREAARERLKKKSATAMRQTNHF